MISSRGGGAGRRSRLPPLPRRPAGTLSLTLVGLFGMRDDRLLLPSRVRGASGGGAPRRYKSAAAWVPRNELVNVLVLVISNELLSVGRDESISNVRSTCGMEEAGRIQMDPLQPMLRSASLARPDCTQSWPFQPLNE